MSERPDTLTARVAWFCVIVGLGLIALNLFRSHP